MLLLASQKKRSFLELVDGKMKKVKLHNDLVELTKPKGLKLGISQDDN